MSRRVNSRGDILEAAEAIVCSQGAGHLTLDAVAEQAGISKGGLLYNFPTKEALLRAMLARLLEKFEVDRLAVQTGVGAGAGLKAFIRTAFCEADERQRVSVALLAAGANDPKLLAPVREWHERHYAEFSAGSRHPLRVLILMLAMDGLWLNELLQTSCFGPELKHQLLEEMLACAKGAV